MEWEGRSLLWLSQDFKSFDILCLLDVQREWKREQHTFPLSFLVLVSEEKISSELRAREKTEEGREENQNRKEKIEGFLYHLFI